MESEKINNLHSVGCSKLVLGDDESHHGPQCAGQHWVWKTHANLEMQTEEIRLKKSLTQHFHTMAM